MSEATATTDLSALTGTWTIDPAHSRLGFSAKHAMVTTVRGHFTEFEGTLQLDGSAPAASAASLTIQAASFDTGVADRDGHVKSADFLDVEQFPTLTFASTKIVDEGDDEYVVVGDLTIKGVTRPVELKLEFEGSSQDPFGNTRAGFSGSTTISRKDFGLTWNVVLDAGGVLVSDKVKIQLDVSAIKAS
ncbi:YceI family protein [Frankia sp. CNm7]|uniref:YceI family protein n=1 Tax=Frankia nepalensis TaxID=1836974 RepID=A0A937URX4_9ACTN|nr:YceI family protein [Frankia nepalensis]MBL7500129.1 YceI family protein [Frankia nepalensis]MBL7511161.1 YceI family protein [Frankia nepalensis]MBL7517838.1 YceI family protein [Frankia nepalensis]MBL7631573.1 YceI family protein [Frankia nepalensis]